MSCHCFAVIHVMLPVLLFMVRVFLLSRVQRAKGCQGHEMQFAADGGFRIFRAFLPGVGKENLQETPMIGGKNHGFPSNFPQTKLEQRSVALGSLVLVICFYSLNATG